MKSTTQQKRGNTTINNQYDTDAERPSIEHDYIDYILGYEITDNEHDNNTFYEELPIEKWYFD